MKIKRITKFKASVILLVAITLVLSIFLIDALSKIESLSINLVNSENKLMLVTDELDKTNSSLNAKNDECSILIAELETSKEVIESLKSEEHVFEYSVTDIEIDMIAKTVWGEARGCDMLGQSAVVWCILNRVDEGRGTIAQVITSPGQFHGYHKSFPVEDNIRMLVQDVIYRWKLEKAGCGNVGRTLPSDYTYFSANRYGTGNVFRNKFDGDYSVWDWNCWNPYE